MITHNQLPNIDWSIGHLNRPYFAWEIGKQTGYHGTSSQSLHDIVRYGALKADYSQCQREDRGVFFGVDYQGIDGNIISGFQFALGRGQHKAISGNGKLLIFQVTADMLQTSKLEPQIALIRDDVSLEMLNQAYFLGNLRYQEKELLRKIGYQHFDDYEFPITEEDLLVFTLARR